MGGSPVRPAIGITMSQLSTGRKTVGDFVLFVTVSTGITCWVPEILSDVKLLEKYQSDVGFNTDNLMKLVAEPKEIEDRTDAKTIIQAKGKIEFDHVGFSYDGKGSALQDISFTVSAGSSVALVGKRVDLENPPFSNCYSGSMILLLDSSDWMEWTFTILLKQVIEVKSVVYRKTLPCSTIQSGALLDIIAFLKVAAEDALNAQWIAAEDALNVQWIAAEDALNVKQMAAKALERGVKKLEARVDKLVAPSRLSTLASSFFTTRSSASAAIHCTFSASLAAIHCAFSASSAAIRCTFSASLAAICCTFSASSWATFREAMMSS
ncbi:hypothetical protein KEM48_002168 [Puccinia striiformis f. sp. tritici PST-130]|nr:hypothetical protein H4Q26_002483 [Puccinia striiformis f. sp. tritici PST-130]KAI9605469.1 hypothetical protein KEM48_002168 [Puccinia striiformis f. sp. tritici PST-130]